MPENSAGDGGSIAELYRVNGHEFEVTDEFDGDEAVQCRECMIHQFIYADKDAEEYLDLMTPECHIEWLRKPDDGFHGVALRNASGFSGRELIGVKEGEGVVDSVRVYDDDAGLLSSMLDKSDWQRREGSS